MREEPTNLEDDLLYAHLFIVKLIPSKFEKITHFLHTKKAPNEITNKNRIS